MTYELAKQLKDAGFPQEDPRMKPLTLGTKEFHEAMLRMREDCYTPTLSELIEACGDSLVLHGPGTVDVNEEYYQPSQDKWVVFWQGRRGVPPSEGETPEEAVAKLWLELNKKTS